MAFNSRWVPFVWLAVTAAMPTSLLAQTVSPKDAAAVEFFEKKIRPLT